MFRRKLESDLLKWKENIDKKALILRGARQVGKTSLIRKFGQENYSNFIEINLERKDHLNIFNGVLSVDDFIRRVNSLTQNTIVENETLLFIDEIQESRDVLDLLRFFSEDKPNLDVIVAGSLLEARMVKGWNVPVGRVEYMYLYPMTFFEYLDAIGQTKLTNDPKNAEYLLKKHLNDYLIVGGMPEAVSNFTKNSNLEKVREVHEKLVNSYKDDLDKYSKDTDRKYLELVMEIGPTIAGSIFNYENFGNSGFRSREIGDAVKILQSVMLLKEIMSINSTSLPIVHKYKRAKKMIWVDVGISNHSNNMYLSIIKNEYKGRMMEQLVGQTLLAGGLRKAVDLVYWAKNKDEGNAEVDFCFQYKDKIVAIEVKSGSTKNMKSIFSMINSGGDKIIPIRVSWDKFGIENFQHSGKKYKILSIPFYLLEDWEELIKAFNK